MRCLWGLFKWPKWQKVEEERQLPLDTLDSVTLLQSWNRDWNGEARGGNLPSNLRGRYVRFGIGGAGNVRKYSFLSLDTNHLVSAGYELTDTSGVNRVISHNGREIRTTAR
jgi:hypothetical protein